MKRALISALLVAGCTLDRGACAAECRGLEGAELWDINAQVDEQRQVTLVEYFFGKPEDSVRSLRALVEVYRRGQCTDLVPEATRDAFRYDEMLAVGRLARQYERLGRRDQAKRKTERAVELGRGVLHKPSWSADDLTQVLDELDAKQRAFLLKVRASAPKQEKD